MADFLDEKRREIKERLDELRPLIHEVDRLQAALNALDGVKEPGSGSGSGNGPRRSSGRGRASSSGATGAKRGRPRGSGTRAGEALAIVKDNPGITIADMADRMGIKRNYLYRVLPTLEQEGMVHKQGGGWHAKDAA